MIGERVTTIVTIVILILGFLCLFLISWFICKKIKKKFYIVAISIWLIIFFINCIAVVFNIPWIIGINVAARWDGGVNGKYISLGYAISVEGHNLLGESNCDLHFTSLFNY